MVDQKPSLLSTQKSSRRRFIHRGIAFAAIGAGGGLLLPDSKLAKASGSGGSSVRALSEEAYKRTLGPTYPWMPGGTYLVPYPESPNAGI